MFYINFLDTMRTTLCCPAKFYIYQFILKNNRENIKVRFWNIPFLQISDVLACPSAGRARAAFTGVIGAIHKYWSNTEAVPVNQTLRTLPEVAGFLCASEEIWVKFINYLQSYQKILFTSKSTRPVNSVHASGVATTLSVRGTGGLKEEIYF